MTIFLHCPGNLWTSSYEPAGTSGAVVVGASAVETKLLKALFKRIYHSFPKKWRAMRRPLWFQFTMWLACFMSCLEKKPLLNSILRDKRKEFYQGLPGVNLIGAVDSEFGLGEYARLSAEVLSRTDVPFGVINYSEKIPQRHKALFRQDVLMESNKYKINLFHINADSLVDVFFAFGKKFFSKRYNIGCPFWELEKFPCEWAPALSLVDEVWAPSEFVQKSLSGAIDKPVIYMTAGITLPVIPKLERAHFNVPMDHYMFFFAFDFFSYIDRKNPYAVICAFKKAFPAGSESVGLIIKTMNVDKKDARWQRLCELIGDDKRIRVISEIMDREELLALKAVCDCYVSLHRSEGLGLGILEAMLLEKPVICTNYSGNLDYTKDDNSCLVRYKLIPVEENQYVFYKGQQWADPDIDHAAWYMKKLSGNHGWGDELGEKAAQSIRGCYNPASCGERYKQRFLKLGLI